VCVVCVCMCVCVVCVCVCFGIQTPKSLKLFLGRNQVHGISRVFIRMQIKCDRMKLNVPKT